jgi:hypothetical protein
MSSPYRVMYCRCSNQLVADELLEISRAMTERGHPIDHVGRQVEAVQVIEHRHVERRSRGAFLFVAAQVQVLVVGAAVGQPVNQPGIAVVGEDNRFVGGEQGVEFPVREPAGVFLLGCRVMRSTTLITRIFTPGKCWRSRSTAASVSRAGTSPAHAMTTSGSPSWSLLAHSQMPMPPCSA